MRLFNLLVLLGLGIPVELADVGGVARGWASFRRLQGRRNGDDGPA